jgi:beta-1,4-mannosyltransferase
MSSRQLPASLPRVIMHPPTSHAGANQTVILLKDALAVRGMAAEDFSWRAAFLSRRSVVHVHWPEHMVLPARSLSGLIRSIALIIWSITKRMRGQKVILTVHNIEPHETRSSIERLALRLFDMTVDSRVYMYDAALPAMHGNQDIVIRRGDYSPQHPAESAEDARPGEEILLFGAIRPYKGVEALIEAYSSIDPCIRPPLRIAGTPHSPDYAHLIRQLAKNVQGVELDFRRIPDDELASLILAARVVVLPYKRVYNSGVALLALTLATPVLARDSPTMRELRREVGEDWVSLFGELSSQTIVDAYRRARDVTGRPDLSSRRWDEVAARYIELYESVSRDVK